MLFLCFQVVMCTLDSIDRRAPHEKYATVIIVHRFTGVLLFELVADFTLGSIRCFQTDSLRCESRIDCRLCNIVNCKIHSTGICLEQLALHGLWLP